MNTTYIDPQLNPQHLANTMHPPSNGHQTYVPAFENNAVPAMVPHQQVYFTPPRPFSQEHQPPNGPNEAILPYNNMDYNNPVTSSSPEFVPNNNDPAAATTTDLSDSIINNSTVPYQYQVQLPRPHQIDSPSTPSPRLLRPPSQQLIRWAQRPKFATSYWEEENTLCYQVDANGICVARRKDNDMINGTKLLNVTGISRGKRDGILKNEKARVVVKVGSMHFKGVWITFSRAKELANRFSITECLNPLLLDDPSSYFQNQQQNNGATAPSSVYLMPPNQSKVEPEQVPTHISSRPASPIMLEPCLPQQQNMTNPAASSSASTVLPTAAALITSPYFPPPASSSSSAGGSRNSSPFIKHHIYPSYDSTHSRNSSSSSLFSLGQQQAPMTNVYHNQQSLQNQSHLENNMAFIPPPPPPRQYNNINNMPQTNYVYSTPSTNSPAPSTPADPAATFHFENSSHNYYQQARTAHLQNNYQTASNDMSSYPTAEQHYHHYLH